MGGREGRRGEGREKEKEGGRREDTIYESFSVVIVTCMSSIKLNHRYCSNYAHNYQQLYAQCKCGYVLLPLSLHSKKHCSLFIIWSCCYYYSP